MAITELIFPRIKTDPASLEEIEQNWPVISKRLIDPNPGLYNAYRGWILTEDGRDVRDDYKEFLIFEWDAVDSFHTFVGSQQFAAFAGLIKHLNNGPPTLQLFDTALSPKDAASAPVVEIIRVSVSSSEDVVSALQIWEKLSHYLGGKEAGRASITYGKSLNLEGDVVMGMIGWSSLESQSEIVRGGDFVNALDSFNSLGELSRITVDVEAIDLKAL